MPSYLSSFDASEAFIGPPWFDKLAQSINGHSRGLLLVGGAFQLLVLISMIAVYSAPLVFGERILLHVVPVDPRDLFRGDYVILSYDFSRTPSTGISGMAVPTNWRTGSWDRDSWLEDRAVYAQLEPESDGKHFRATGITFDRPASGRYLKGKFSRSGDGNDLHFGIEAYYVQEKEGKVLERLRNSGQLSAEIALTPWGQAILCALK